MINRWFIAFACAWINLFIFSIFRSSGLIYVKLLDLFECTHHQAAYSVSLVGSVASTTGIVSGFLTHYFTPRSLIITGILICSISVSITSLANSIYFVIVSIGIFQGIGIGFVTCLLPMVLSSYFDEQKSIALGISYAGATLGAFIFPLLIQSMFLQYGFHGTMLIFGGVIMNAILGGAMLKTPTRRSEYQQQNQQRNEPESSIQIDKEKNSMDNFHKHTLTSIRKESETHEKFWQKFKKNLVHDHKLLSNFHFILCSFTYINFIFDFIAFIIILPDIAKNRNIEASDARWLLSIFAITDFIGRLVPGLLSSWKIISDKLTYVLSITILGLCMFLIVTIESWSHFVIVTLLCGFVTGCQMVLSPAVLVDYLGAENTAIAFGMENFFCGFLSMFLRPMIIGIKDIYGNYEKLGYILLTSVSINVVLWVFDIVFQKIKN